MRNTIAPRSWHGYLLDMSTFVSVHWFKDNVTSVTVGLTLCLSVCLHVCLSICLPVCMSMCMSVCVCGQWADKLVENYTVVESRELETRRQFDECIGESVLVNSLMSVLVSQF